MGCNGSKTAENEMDARINQQLKDERRRLNREIKLLLLGTGESGKSTIAKQLKILHSDGFDEAELLTYKPVITNNILTAYKNIVNATEMFGQLPDLLSSTELKEAVTYFQNAEPIKDELTPAVATYVKQLYTSPTIQETLTKYSQFQLPDCTLYLTEHVERLCSPTYVPTQEDVLRCRARTTGIVELDFTFDGIKFRVVDVGGQRSERRKWIHTFEGVTAIIFCVALNEYDQKLYENEKVNRMHEAAELFEEICNSEWFVKTDIILFLNKEDLFRTKISQVDLNVCFSEYTGGKDYDKACNFIKEKFVTLNKNPAKQIFTKVTCATDTRNIELVFAAAKNIILRQQLQGAGF